MIYYWDLFVTSVHIFTWIYVVDKLYINYKFSQNRDTLIIELNRVYEEMKEPIRLVKLPGKICDNYILHSCEKMRESTIISEMFIYSYQHTARRSPDYPLYLLMVIGDLRNLKAL